jgi:hypothetical protein
MMCGARPHVFKSAYYNLEYNLQQFSAHEQSDEKPLHRQLDPCYLKAPKPTLRIVRHML